MNSNSKMWIKIPYNDLKIGDRIKLTDRAIYIVNFIDIIDDNIIRIIYNKYHTIYRNIHDQVDILDHKYNINYIIYHDPIKFEEIILANFIAAMDNNFIYFLMGKHKRVGTESAVHMLCNDVIDIIHEYYDKSKFMMSANIPVNSYNMKNIQLPYMPITSYMHILGWLKRSQQQYMQIKYIIDNNIVYIIEISIYINLESGPSHIASYI